MIIIIINNMFIMKNLTYFRKPVRIRACRYIQFSKECIKGN